MTKESKQTKIGMIGEEAAVNFLKDNGYKILDRNFKNVCGRVVGEIDIIAEDPTSRSLVFTEVKTRAYKSLGCSLPEESITPSKLRKLERAVAVYLQTNKLSDSNYRFDAISVLITKENKAHIRHLKSIFL